MPLHESPFTLAQVHMQIVAFKGLSKICFKFDGNFDDLDFSRNDTRCTVPQWPKNRLNFHWARAPRVLAAHFKILLNTYIVFELGVSKIFCDYS